MLRTATPRALYCAFALLLLSSRTSAQTVTLGWDASPSPGVAGYYVYVGTSPGQYTFSFNAGNVTAFVVPGLTVGVNYCFAVQSYNTAGQQSWFSNEVCGLPTELLSISSFSANTDLPAPAGVPLTWIARTRGGDGSALEFQFFRQNVATGSWTIVQPYGPNNSYTWTPSAADAGRYALQVWIRKAGGSALETWAGTAPFWITDFALTNVSPDVSPPVWPGLPITWRATVVGSTPLEYRFWRYNATAHQWILARDYSTTSTYTWTPTASDVGRHWLQVWARPVGSTADFQAWRNDAEFEIRPTQPGLNVAVGRNAETPISPGQTVTWRAITTGGTGPFEYSFYRYNVSAGTWTLLRDWSTTSTAAWTPASSDRGSHFVQLWVRRVGSSALDGWRNGPDQMVSAIKGAWLVPSVALPARAGTLITWMAGALGSATSVEYKFWLYSASTGQWTLLRDWNPASTYNWVPAVAGTYVVQVWMRTTGSPAALEAWQGTGGFAILP